MPGAPKNHKESGYGNFGVRITYRATQASETKWFAIEERREQVFNKAKKDPNVLFVSKKNKKME